MKSIQGGSAILICNFAKNVTSQLVGSAGMARQRSARMTDGLRAPHLSEAARFMLICEQEHGISRQAFRSVFIQALQEHQMDSVEQRYFIEQPSVFAGWFVPSNGMPAWASMVAAEIMFGMLADGSTPQKLRRVVEHRLPAVVDEVAGGRSMLQWLLAADARTKTLRNMQ